jgi:hypothetical protein
MGFIFQFNEKSVREIAQNQAEISALPDWMEISPLLDIL